MEQWTGDGTTEVHEEQTKTVRAGYNIIYIVLVIYTIIFCFTYLKRVVYMAFLTIIAPLVAITYPIDKINDGKAQAFDLWLKEYLFNLLIQPMHLILYTILIGSAMRFAANNIFYVVIALGFLMPAEKLLRRFFGFEKAQTPGMFGGAAGTALMMSGLSRLMHPRPPKKELGSGNREDSEASDDGKNPTMNDKIDYANIFGNEDNGRDRDIGRDTDIGRDMQLLGDVGDQAEDLNNDRFRLSDRQKTEIKNLETEEGIGPGDQEWDMALRNMGIDPKEYLKSEQHSNNNIQTNRNRGNKSPTTSRPPVKLPNINKSPKTKDVTKRKKSKIRGFQSGLRSVGNKVNKYRGKTNSQMAAIIAKKGLGLGAKVGATALGISAAGLASIAGGDPSKAIQNMSVAGTAGYTLGKGIAERVEKSSIQEHVDAVREGYYGDDYKEIKQKKYEKKFVKDEDNLKKIEQKLGVERDRAKEIAEQLSEYTRADGIKDIEQTLAIYRMQKEEGFSEEAALRIASYNAVGLSGVDTRYMKADDRQRYKESYRNTLMNKKGINQQEADKYTDRVFSAMDKYNDLK